MSTEKTAQEGFTEMYRGTPPWEIGKPQAAFVAAADKVRSPVLDAGCGTGNTALFLAARGLQVTGVDFVEDAIAQARAKAAARGLDAAFLVKDAMTLGEWDARFASVIDSGLFHIYEGDERQRYVRGLAHVLEPGGRLFLLSFTDARSDHGPPGGVSREAFYAIFADGWEVESVAPVQGEVNPAYEDDFPDGGPKMWFAIIRRTGA